MPSHYGKLSTQVLVVSGISRLKDKVWMQPTYNTQLRSIYTAHYCYGIALPVCPFGLSAGIFYHNFNKIPPEK